MRKLRVPLLSLIALLMGSLASAETIELESGDKFDVTIIEETETTLIVEHPVLGRMEVPKSSLKKPEPEKPGLFGTNFLKGFTREVGFGIGGASGNLDNLSINANLGIHRETSTYRSHFDATYFYANASDPTATNPYKRGALATSNQFIGDYQHDLILFESRFFFFGNVRYAFDAFQLWRNRLTISGGPGVEILKRDKLSLRGELGVAGTGNWPSTSPDNRLLAIGMQKEFVESYAERQRIKGWSPELVVAVIFTWKPLDGHSFKFDTSYLPTLTDLPQFRLLTNAAYTVSLPGPKGLGLKFGLTNEYTSDSGRGALLPPQPDGTATPLEKNNLKYFGNVVYEF
jgi:hypothetical protein